MNNSKKSYKEALKTNKYGISSEPISQAAILLQILLVNFAIKPEFPACTASDTKAATEQTTHKNTR
ncbi:MULTISPECIES: hypothetical protein [Shewanella]|uniref:hypothetical protein n=1 Tax=Shewanella TaxID=22 RepID=UPI0011450E0F|nr:MULTISPECIES: hypothetical protein [Shewanella]MBO2684825.1 hypothetical protein [Shewanella algae]MDC8853539.1 hypothetical protein [Shewanella algae]NJI85659.1 hypothetical protein [Shewanella sp. Iso12]QNI00256.1 hypothetical protein HU689_17760 [Shewanella algae]QTE90048.1 hypothetical protein JKK33_17030 [Shewanella algae]